MKVMCVNSPLAWLILGSLLGKRVPEVGDKCTVKNTRRCKCGKHDVYEFEEFYLPTGFKVDCFAVMPEQDADDIEAAEKEAIVPNPMLVESDPLSVEEKAVRAYYQVYELTGCEKRAAAAYYETLQNDLP